MIIFYGLDLKTYKSFKFAYYQSYHKYTIKKKHPHENFKKRDDIDD